MATAQGGLRPRGRLRRSAWLCPEQGAQSAFCLQSKHLACCERGLDLDLRPELACALVATALCVQPARNWVPIRQIAIGKFGAESDKAWSLRERRLACLAPKARLPTFEPKVPSCPGFPAVPPRPHPLSPPWRRQPVCGQGLARASPRADAFGAPMPPLIRPGRSRNPAASPSHRACWRASLWTAAIRRRRTRTSCCAASASGSAATVSARTFSRKAPRFILPERSIRCWLFLRHAFWDRTASRIGRRSRHFRQQS